MTTPTKTDLLPCPFCGKEARLAENHDVGSINCFANGCDVEPVVTWREGKKSEAIAQWNTRTPTVNLAELRERVKDKKRFLPEDTDEVEYFWECHGFNAALDAVIALIDGGE